MTDVPGTAVVVDTMVFSWLLRERDHLLADVYEELIGESPIVLALQTLAELRYGDWSADGESFAGEGLSVHCRQ